NNFAGLFITVTDLVTVFEGFDGHCVLQLLDKKVIYTELQLTHCQMNLTQRRAESKEKNAKSRQKLKKTPRKAGRLKCYLNDSYAFAAVTATQLQPLGMIC
ncbi:MAG: hypothetical protein OEM65_01235, partial [Desulfuromonadales bacterium]|nr:hypothetical protein [Desulfuromonadales bacterium]